MSSSRYVELSISTHCAGIGYAMFMLSLYIGTYYNVILSWAFFYIFSSFTTSLPWASCDNWWNTAACTRFDSTNCTAHGGIMNREGSDTQTNICLVLMVL